jgi:hypothetical protein
MVLHFMFVKTTVKAAFKNPPFILYKLKLLIISIYSKGGIGSFRLTMVLTYLHVKFNFIRTILETVEKSLHHSCKSLIK